MIPMMHIVAWSNVVPWVEPRQVEQDLIISRARGGLDPEVLVDRVAARSHAQGR